MLCFRGNTELPVASTVTVEGQVTLAKKIRDAAGIKPGDRMCVRATAAGTAIIEMTGGEVEAPS